MSLAVAFVGKEIHVYRPFLVQLYFAVALSIFFCSIFLTLQHFWRTPFDKGQLYQAPTSVSLLFLSLGATLLGVFLPLF